MFDNLGDRMKTYEKHATNQFLIRGLPVYARIDGKSFSRLTKKLPRPYCEKFSNCMIETTKHLVNETDAVIGYTQSDEISLGWYSPDPNSQLWFDGKIQKMASVIAAMASVAFLEQLREHIPELVVKLPVFDTRVFNVPNENELANAFLWRELDCTKNAISMVAQHYFSHNSLQGVNSKQMQEKLWHEKNINFNDYPAFFKRGTWVRKETVSKSLTPEELENIPLEFRPVGPVKRNVTNSFTLDKPFTSK